MTPDPEVFTREPTSKPSVVGNSRLPFELWEPVVVGDVSVLDDLPKKVAKEKVRAVATEIVDFEGPIHLDRLAQLVAASFGLKKLWPEGPLQAQVTGWVTRPEGPAWCRGWS